MYAECGKVTEAEIVFKAFKKCNIVTWNAMLATYVKHMQEEGVGLD